MALSQDLTRYICLFHSAERAHAAVAALQNVGLSNIDTLGDGESATGLTSSQSLIDLHVPERDIEHLQDGIRKGGVVVSLQAPGDRDKEIEKIFHHYSAGKIDETDRDLAPLAPVAAVAAPLARSRTETLEAPGTVIPVAAEDLQVGKREVDRGGVRVYRRTVEEPVSQSVDLHAERVVLGYREVDRPATDADLRAGSQQIELIETAEVPTVQKVSRVVEEVHVGKVETDHVEVVRDTVRHTEVEVEDLAAQPRSPSDTRR